MYYIFQGVGDQADDNSYLSWDIKYGEFDGDTNTVDWVASAPRSYFLKGNTSDNINCSDTTVVYL